MKTPESTRGRQTLDAFADPHIYPSVANRMFYLLKDLHHLAEEENIDWGDLLRRVEASYQLEKKT